MGQAPPKQPAEFVTVLRSSNAALVRMILPVLDEEGIEYQHPGLEHASMIPGLGFVEVNLRVRGNRAEEAQKLIDALMNHPPEIAEGDIAQAEIEQGIVTRPGSPYRGGGAPVAFIYPQDRAALGGTWGLLAGIAAVVGFELVGHALPPPMAVTALFLPPVMGFLRGWQMKTHHCSFPGCRAPIEPDAKRCESCGADIVGTIEHERDHQEAVEGYREKLQLPP